MVVDLNGNLLKMRSLEKTMGRKNWTKCYDCGRKLNVKRMEKSGNNHGCEYCWRKNRKKERRNVHVQS